MESQTSEQRPLYPVVVSVSSEDEPGGDQTQTLRRARQLGAETSEVDAMKLHLPVLENCIQLLLREELPLRGVKKQGWSDSQEPEADRREQVPPHERPLLTEPVTGPAGKAGRRSAGS